MKRAIIGGFISLVGSIWTLAIIFIAGNNLASGWATPPGRFLTTLSELNLTSLFAVSVLLTLVGILIMAIEFFKKGQN